MKPFLSFNKHIEEIKHLSEVCKGNFDTCKEVN